MQTKMRLRIFWFMLMGAVALASLWLGPNEKISPLGAIVGHKWAHFLIYVAVASIALLAWKKLTGLLLAVGAAVLSICLQIIRGMITGFTTDTRALVINLLGIAAGVLLGLNILTLQSKSQPELSSRHEV